MVAIFFDTDDDAAELIKALHEEGYETTLTREEFAGEDDAEDPAWILQVDPFDERVTEMVDVYGGWLPGDEQLPADQAQPAELPTAPKQQYRSQD